MAPVIMKMSASRACNVHSEALSRRLARLTVVKLVSPDQLHATPGRSHSGMVLQNESRERCSATYRYARSSSLRIDGSRYICAIQDQGRPSSLRTRLTAAAPLDKVPLESTALSSLSVCVRVRPYCSTRPGVCLE